MMPLKYDNFRFFELVLLKKKTLNGVRWNLKQYIVFSPVIEILGK